MGNALDGKSLEAKLPDPNNSNFAPFFSKAFPAFSQYEIKPYFLVHMSLPRVLHVEEPFFGHPKGKKYILRG